MTDIERLIDLLLSPDPSTRSYGMELAASLGRAASDAALQSFVLEGDGLLWRPGGFSAELLSLALSASPLVVAQVRRLVLGIRIDAALLAQIAALPGLCDLTLSHVPVADLSPIATMPALTRLTINRSRLNIAPLSRMRGLTHLSLAGSKVDSLRPIRGMRSLRSLCLRGVDAPSTAAPEGVTHLDLMGFHSNITNLNTLSLHTLKATHFVAKHFTGRDRLASLSVERCDDPSVYYGVPVEHLELEVKSRTSSDLAALLPLTGLTSVRLKKASGYRKLLRSPGALATHPTLTVVEIEDAEAWGPVPQSPRWVMPAEQLQYTWTTDARPVVQRSADHWWQRGRNMMLTSEQDLSSALRFVRPLHRAAVMPLKRAKMLLDGLRTQGWPCLTLAEAIEHQGWLHRAGVGAQITPWSGQCPPGSPQSQT